MKHAMILSAMLALAPMNATAQAQDNSLSRGAELLREGMELMLEGLLNEMRPLGEELADNWAENWTNLLEMLGDFSAYEAPVILPNGDILIRRKESLEPQEQPLADGQRGEGREIDL